MSPEPLEGYVIDVGCIRKNPRGELLKQARTHSSDCALMGPCVESGYGIVTDNDQLTVLDTEATPKVVDTVEESNTDEGIRLRVQREEQDGTVETIRIEETQE